MTDFLDTNVFVYAFDERERQKRAVAQDLIASAIRDRTAVISHQVVQETLRVLTAKARLGVAPRVAGTFMEQMLLPLWRSRPEPSMYQLCLQIQDRYGFEFYDSLIVAAALEAQCDRLLTEDLQHGQRIESLVIENPFLE